MHTIIQNTLVSINKTIHNIHYAPLVCSIFSPPPAVFWHFLFLCYVSMIIFILFILFFINFINPTLYISSFLLCIIIFYIQFQHLLPTICPNPQKTAISGGFYIFNRYIIPIIYLILAAFFAAFATLLTLVVKDFIPLVKSASSTSPIFSAFTVEQQYGHFVANLLIDC